MSTTDIKRDLAKSHVTSHWARKDSYKIFDKMITELSLYMAGDELDRCQSFLFQCEQGEFDTNLTISDMEWQLKIILGSERYVMIRDQWNQQNQKILTVFGTMKLKCKKTGVLYDGLDDGDDPSDYERVYV